MQEFFIRQSKIEATDLLSIYKAIHSGESWTTLDDLSLSTGLHPVQLRVALSVLELAGSLEHLGDEGIQVIYRKGTWNPEEIKKATQRSLEHLRLRQKHLDNMVNYAESNQCRRKIILKHFGDMDGSKSTDCCDNCRSKGAGADSKKSNTELSQGQLTALIILDCILRQKIKVGKGKLAQILHGSRARDILKFHYEKNIYYGRLAAAKQSDIETLIGQLVEKGYAKIVGGEYPVLNLTPKGEVAIQNREGIVLIVPKSLDESTFNHAKAKQEAGGTVEYRSKLFANGLTPEQIAEERGLAISTIYSHLAQLISAGRISVDQVVPENVREQIEQAIQKAGPTQYLYPIRAFLPDSIGFDLIRCVVAGHKKNDADSNQIYREKDLKIEQAVLECVHTYPGQLPRSGVAKLLIGSFSQRTEVYRTHSLYNRLHGYSRGEVMQIIDLMLGQNRLIKNDYGYLIKPEEKSTKHHSDVGEIIPRDTIMTDAIETFIVQAHPRPLIGSWTCGWSLSFHSRFSGGNWMRSSVGDLTYRLKYEGDTSVLPLLVTQTVELIRLHPELIQVDFILPVPPSTVRPADPVQLFCQAFAEKIRIPMHPSLAKTRQTQPQKVMKTFAQKRANVKGAFTLRDDVKGKRLLLVDDLFDSGSTLEEITRLLIKNGALVVTVLTLTCTIHTDA